MARRSSYERSRRRCQLWQINCGPRPDALRNGALVWERIRKSSVISFFINVLLNNSGCPARIRTSINGVRVRCLTIRRRGKRAGHLCGATPKVKCSSAMSCLPVLRLFCNVLSKSPVSRRDKNKKVCSAWRKYLRRIGASDRENQGKAFLRHRKIASSHPVFHPFQNARPVMTAPAMSPRGYPGHLVNGALPRAVRLPFIGKPMQRSTLEPIIAAC